MVLITYKCQAAILGNTCVDFGFIYEITTFAQFFFFALHTHSFVQYFLIDIMAIFAAIFVSFVILIKRYVITTDSIRKPNPSVSGIWKKDKNN